MDLKESISKNKIAGIFGGISIVFLTITIIVTIKIQKFVNNSVVATGVIVDSSLETSRDSDGSVSRSIYPVIEFKDSNGSTIIYKSNTTSSNSVILGEKVNIRYEIGNPKNASIDTWVDIWFPILILGFFFLLFSTFTILFFKFN